MLAAKLPIYLHRSDYFTPAADNARSIVPLPEPVVAHWPKPEPQAGDTFLRPPSKERKAMSPALELLALLDPGSSQYIAEMQNTGSFRTADEWAEALAAKRAASAKACPRCHGRRRLQKDVDAFDAYRAFIDTIAEHAFKSTESGTPFEDNLPPAVPRVDSPWCTRCQGSGLLLESGHRASTPSKEAPRAERLSAQDVAAMLAGVEHHKVRAAMVYMLDDEASRLRLDADVRDRIVIPSVASWKDGGSEDREEQIEWMSWFAVTALRMAGGRQIQARHAAPRLGVTLPNWYKQWQPRHRRHVAELEGWVVDVSAVLDGQRSARWTA